MLLRRIAEHLHRQLGLRQAVLRRHRAQVRHPVLALRDAGADGTRAVPAGQHAGRRRMRARRFTGQASRLRQRTGETEAGDELELLLLLLGLLLQLQLQNVLHRKGRGGRS